MCNYSFHYYSGDDYLKTESKELLDDLDALELAERLSYQSEIEVWDDTRYVARVKKVNKPIDVNDLKVG